MGAHLNRRKKISRVKRYDFELFYFKEIFVER